MILGTVRPSLPHGPERAASPVWPPGRRGGGCRSNDETPEGDPMKPQDRTRAILRSDLPSLQRLILIAIADYMGGDDTAFPGVPTISRDSGISERRVKGHIKALSDAGVIHRQFRPGPKPPVYSIRWSALTRDETSPGRSVTSDGTSPVPVTERPPLPVTERPSEADQGSDQEATTMDGPEKETQNEARTEQSQDAGMEGQQVAGRGGRSTRDAVACGAASAEREPMPAVGDGARVDGVGRAEAGKRAAKAVDLKALWAKVNDITPGRPLKLTNARRASLKARAGEHSAEDVLTVVRWVHNSDHKRARELREGGWTKPETYLRPRNFIAYLEFAEEGRHDETPNNGKQRPLPTGEPTRLFV
jgi:hypothetical protein